VPPSRIPRFKLVLLVSFMGAHQVSVCESILFNATRRTRILFPNLRLGICPVRIASYAEARLNPKTLAAASTLRVKGSSGFPGMAT
jgi:hypothetical protein